MKPYLARLTDDELAHLLNQLKAVLAVQRFLLSISEDTDEAVKYFEELLMGYALDPSASLVPDLETQSLPLPPIVGEPVQVAGGVQLNWSAPADVSQIEGYTVERDSVQIMACANVFNFLDAAPNYGSTSVYTIKSCGANGNNSENVNVTIVVTDEPDGLFGFVTPANGSTHGQVVDIELFAPEGDWLQLVGSYDPQPAGGASSSAVNFGNLGTTVKSMQYVDTNGPGNIYFRLFRWPAAYVSATGPNNDAPNPHTSGNTLDLTITLDYAVPPPTFVGTLGNINTNVGSSVTRDLTTGFEYAGGLTYTLNNGIGLSGLGLSFSNGVISGTATTQGSITGLSITATSDDDNGSITSPEFNVTVGAAPSVTGLYVSPSGNDSNPGTIGSPKRQVAAALAISDNVWAAPGPYNPWVTTRAGQTVRGYTNTPGDKPEHNDFDHTTSIDKARFPYIEASSRNNDQNAITLAHANSKVSGWACRQYRTGLYISGNSCEYENIYVRDNGDYSRTNNYHGTAIKTIGDDTIGRNSRVANCCAELFVWGGDRGIGENLHAFCDDNTPGTGSNNSTSTGATDYYFAVNGLYNKFYDCTIYREPGIGHGGHGFEPKSAENGLGNSASYNEFYRCIAYNMDGGALSARHSSATGNKWFDCQAIGGNGIFLHSGPNGNEWHNCTLTNCASAFVSYTFTEDNLNNPASGGRNNLFKDVTVNNAGNFMILRGNDGGFGTAPTLSNNTWDNLTINGASRFMNLNGVTVLSNNQFINSEFNGISTKLAYSFSGGNSSQYQLNSSSFVNLTNNTGISFP